MFSLHLTADHAAVVATEGESFRMREAKARGHTRHRRRGPRTERAHHPRHQGRRGGGSHVATTADSKLATTATFEMAIDNRYRVSDSQIFARNVDQSVVVSSRDVLSQLAGSVGPRAGRTRR